MRKIIAALLIIPSICLAQKEDDGKTPQLNQLGLNDRWWEGSCMLKDGTELKGVLRYNDKTGVLSYDNGRDPRTFTTKSILGFEFFDEELQQQRVFYSLEYAEPDSPERSYFFELLRDLGQFAVISRADPVAIEEKMSFFNDGVHSTSGGVSDRYTEFSQTETIFFMNTSGKIEPYLQVVEKEVHRFLFDSQKTKNKFVDKDLFERYAGPKWLELVKFADEENLSFKRKGDLLEILAKYQSLISD